MKILFFLILLSFPLMAQDTLQTAMSAYDSGDYSKSVEIFRQIPLEKRDAALEYKYGQCTFQGRKVG